MVEVWWRSRARQTMSISFGQLRWLTVVTPSAVLALYLFATHFILQDFLDTAVAFVILFAIAAVAIFLFSSSRS